MATSSQNKEILKLFDAFILHPEEHTALARELRQKIADAAGDTPADCKVSAQGPDEPSQDDDLFDNLPV